MPRYLSEPHELSSCQLPKCPWFKEFLKHFSSIFIMSCVLLGAGAVTIWHTYHIPSSANDLEPKRKVPWELLSDWTSGWCKNLEINDWSNNFLDVASFARLFKWRKSWYFRQGFVLMYLNWTFRLAKRLSNMPCRDPVWLPNFSGRQSAIGGDFLIEGRVFGLLFHFEVSFWDVGRHACSETWRKTLIFPSLIQGTEQPPIAQVCPQKRFLRS